MELGEGLLEEGPHFGFGSDFDGIEVSPDDVRNPAELPNLLTALRNYGYNDESIERICGGNLKAYFARLK